MKIDFQHLPCKLDCINHDLREEVNFFPIGNGLFSTGFIKNNLTNEYFSWIYDCGTSGKLENLKFVTDHYKNSVVENRYPVPNILFISHFDQDHVNGIASLITDNTIRNYIEYIVAPFFIIRMNKKENSYTITEENGIILEFEDFILYNSNIKIKISDNIEISVFQNTFTNKKESKLLEELILKYKMGEITNIKNIASELYKTYGIKNSKMKNMISNFVTISVVPSEKKSRSSILYTGDGYLKTEEQLDNLKKYIDTDSIIAFQVMHHGSINNISDDIFTKAKPLFNIISKDEINPKLPKQTKDQSYDLTHPYQSYSNITILFKKEELTQNYSSFLATLRNNKSFETYMGNDQLLPECIDHNLKDAFNWFNKSIYIVNFGRLKKLCIPHELCTDSKKCHKKQKS